MNFTKFISILESESLFFAAASSFDDPFEGSIPEANRGINTVSPLIALNSISELREGTTHHTFINCWHVNEYESEAMWKLYGSSIAIKTSFSSLKTQLQRNDKNIELALVNYIDYKQNQIPEWNTRYTYLYKRIAFAHEHELRCIIFDDIPKDNNGRLNSKMNSPHAQGIECLVNIRELISEIYISPTESEKFRSLVEKICKKYSFNKPILQSSLNDSPYF